MSIMDRASRRPSVEIMAGDGPAINTARTADAGTASVRWIISREAMRRAAATPGEFSAALRTWQASDRPDVTQDVVLEWTCAWRGRHDGRFEASATVIDAANRATPTALVRTIGGRCVAVRDGGLTHVHITDPSGEVLLSATLRDASLRGNSDDDRGGVMYASTPILARLGLGGGRYDVAGGQAAWGE